MTATITLPANVPAGATITIKAGKDGVVVEPPGFQTIYHVASRKSGFFRRTEWYVETEFGSVGPFDSAQEAARAIVPGPHDVIVIEEL